MRALGAIETLDFSATGTGDTLALQVTRALMLQEVLSRVELPPFEEIPGLEQVAGGEIEHWTVPGTRITIARQSSGPRTGEYLFSAATVDRLDVDFRRAQAMPYARGATKGMYDEFATSQDPVIAQRMLFRERLEGLDTSSPRATLEGFLASMNEAYRLVKDAEAARSASPPRMTRKEARAIEVQADRALGRATRALDLSQVPAAQRADVAVEAALLLKEVMDRAVLPPIDLVSDASDIASRRESAGPFRWRFPATDIEIVEIEEGERAGEFLFSAATIERIERDYRALVDLPYRDEVYVATIATDFASPDTSPGFYELYISTPGHLVPSASVVGGFADALPGAFQRVRGGQTWWQWIGLLLTLLTFVVIAVVTVWIIGRLASRAASPGKDWIRVLAPVLVLIILRLVHDFANNSINITGGVRSTVLIVVEVIDLILLAWAIWRLSLAVAATIIASPRISEQGIDASLVRIAARLIALVIGAWVVVSGVRDLGLDAVPLLAGLGVGGLAVGLALRPTLENLIGGVILYTDRPVRVGDFCSFGGFKGTVENIGVRSTQVRGLDRTRISIPNAKFADMEIVNFAHCDRMLINAQIGLRYETEPDQLRYVLARMREMFHAHPKIDRDTVRVRFAGYGAASLDVAIRVYALTRDWNEFHAIREDVFLRISDIVKDAGTGFAIPSQTLYLGRDDGLDEEQGKSAMEEVAAWRRSGELPFPRLKDRRMDELERTLDWPPAGSVEATTPEPLSTEEPEATTPEPLSTEEPEPLGDEEAERRSTRS